ncbi:MAG: hypothetical protein IBJ13_05880 [Sphingopyxis sp.]|nr:hypothetical protein [Sphingopyxis sp.]
MIRLLIALSLLLSPALALAKGGEGVAMHRIAPASMSPDKAYLFFRSSTAKSGMINTEHVLLRVPTDAEVAAYRAARQTAYDAALPKLTQKSKDGRVPSIEEFVFPYDGPANAFAIDAGEFIEDGEMRSYLVEAVPGTYVLYGVSVGGRDVTACNCLGTVKFEARAGAITNMGALYADKVHKESPVPHVEDNLGPSMFNYGFILGQALVPPETAAPAPPALAGLPMRNAEYHAVGLFREIGSPFINRLAPVPGILGYDRGKVIDLRTGQPVK